MADYRIKVGIELDTANLQRKLNKAAHDQKLNIKAALNVDVTNYKKAIKSLQNNVQDDIQVNVKTEKLTELQEKIGDISKQIDVFNKKGLNTERIKNFNTGLGESVQEIYKLNKGATELQLTVQKVTTDHAAINREKEKEKKLTDEITAKQSKLNDVVAKLKLGAFSKHDLGAFDEISKKINTVSLTAKSSIQELSAYQKELGRVVSNSKLGEVKTDSGLSFKSSQDELQKYLQTLFNAESQFVQIKDKLKVVSLPDGEQWKQHTAIIKNSQGQWEKYVVSINSVSNALRIAKEGIVNVNSNLSNTEEILKARLQSKIDTFQKTLNTNINNLKIGGLSDIDLQRVNALQNEIKSLTTETKEAEQEIKRLGTAYKSITNDLKRGKVIDSGSALGLKASDVELQKYIAGLKQVGAEQVKIANSSKITFGRNGEQIRIVNALVHEGSNAWRQYQYSINKAGQEIRELDKGIQNNTEAILKAKLQSKLDTFQKSLNTNIENMKIGGLNDFDLQRVNSLQKEIKSLTVETKDAEQEMKRLGTAYKGIISDLKSGKLIDSGSVLGLKSSDAELQKYIAGLKQVDIEQVKISNSSKITFGNNGEQIRIVNALVNEGADKWRQYQYAINTASNETRELDKGVKNVTASKSQMISQLKSMVAMYFSLTTAMRLFRKAMSEMKDADTEIITIQKVSKRSTEEMNELMQKSYAVSTEYGRKSAEYLKAVTEFTKGGYGKTADELGKLSLLTQNVGDITGEQANKFLLAADAAWKLNGDVDALTRILDGFNEVANRNATDIGKLADGIRVSGTFFANAGLDVKEYAAIIGTATTVTQQSGDEMGRAWRTILMNIRQMKGETAEGEIVDDKQLANAEKALRKVEIGVREYKNGINELRNPMKVLEELAAKWKTLNSVQQSMLLESIAGKRQANALIAVMDNWDKVVKMQQEYADASGSAMQANDLFTNSWQAKLKTLESAWTQFVAKTVDTSWIKGILDGATKLLGVIGSLGNALIFLAGTFVFLERNHIVSGLAKLTNSFADLFKTIALVITGNMNLATSDQQVALAKDQVAAATIRGRIALLGFGTALNMALGVFGLAITALSLFKMAIDNHNAAVEKARQIAIEHADALMKEKQAIDDLAQKYTEISESVSFDQDARKQLKEIQKELIEQYGIEAGSIDLVNGKYDDNIKKINELRKSKLKAIIDENKVLAETSQDDINKKSYGNPFAYKRGQAYYHPMENLFDKSLSVEEYIAALEDMRKQLTEKSGEFEGIVEKDRQIFAVKLNEKMNKAKEELKKYQENISFVKESMAEFNKITIASANKFRKEREELFRILSAPVELDIENEDKYRNRLKSIAKEINDIPVEKFTELKQAYADYQKAIGTGDNTLLNDSMSKIRDLKKEITHYSSDITHFKKALDDLFDISQFDNDVKTLGKSIKELMFDTISISKH